MFFSFHPGFAFSVTLDFNSQGKKRTRDTPEQLISTLVSEFRFTLSNPLPSDKHRQGQTFAYTIPS